MTDFIALIDSLRRPSLLIRAARCGLADYRRERDLRRLVGSGLTVEAAMTALLAEEARLEARRCAGDNGYPVGRHIDVLIALMAEMRLLPRQPESRA